MKFTVLNEEVLYADGPIVKAGRKEIDLLKKMAEATVRKRIRLCAHRHEDDATHEMLIVHDRGAYVRPHKHTGRTESFHIIEGKADVVIFDDLGIITDVIRMGEFLSGREFYYRMSVASYHTLLIESDVLVFHETTRGPFRREDTVFAAWAPDEKDEGARAEFMRVLEKDVARFLEENKKRAEADG